MEPAQDIGFGVLVEDWRDDLSHLMFCAEGPVMTSVLDAKAGGMCLDMHS